jgi:hypothetical protein
MKLIIKDKSMLNSIDPLDIRDFLRTEGWRKVDVIGNRFSVWLIEKENKEYTINIPNKSTFGDYALRVSEILKVLEETTSKTQLQLFNDIKVSSADVIRVYSRAGLEDGTIYHDDLSLLIEESHKMLLSVASSADSPKAVIGPSQTQQVKEYMSKLIYGQSELGSYVLPIISRIPRKIEGKGDQLVYESVDTPFPRMVTQTLSKSLSIIRDITQKDSVDINKYDKEAMIKRGVSANLCESIANLSGMPSQNIEAKIDLTWSKGYPVLQAVDKSFVFSSRKSMLIMDIANEFRETQPLKRIKLPGKVIRLHKEKEGEDTLREIVLLTYVRGQPKRVFIKLDEESYNSAINAHQNDDVMILKGDLTFESNRYHLNNPFVVGDSLQVRLPYVENHTETAERGYIMYRCGEKPGKGTYICIKCGQRVTLDDDTDTLPPCPSCQGCDYRRA